MKVVTVNIVCVRRVTISVVVDCVCQLPKNVMATMTAGMKVMKPLAQQMELPAD